MSMLHDTRRLSNRGASEAWAKLTLAPTGKEGREIREQRGIHLTAKGNRQAFEQSLERIMNHTKGVLR